MARRRCRNCPDPDEQEPPTPTTSVTMTYEGECGSLWRHALSSCGTLLDLLFNYVVMDVPGDPLLQLKRLHARLGEIIQTREERTCEDSRTAQ